ncbi:MAG: DNA polymerase I [Elusimicrobia bacterium]|nr:DNA polymerase I [Elusimicrobiota bacterium]
MRPRLYLVDAHAYLHRAYHALPPLTSSKGEPVGALLGFSRMLLKLIREEKPDRVAVCFDSPGPTFRHQAFAAYKATRKETDADLVKQLRQAPELAQALGCATVVLQGFEADDLMATLARRAADEGYDAVLVTGDKDALQLVAGGVRVLDPSKGVWMDPPRIEEKLGVGPEAVVDFLALTGDSSDNVPGVRGIGPVGARKLLKDFGTLSAALRAAKEGDPRIPAKTSALLVEGEKDMEAALDLIRLRSDAPVEFQVASCAAPALDLGKLGPLLERLEFHALLRELGGSPSVNGGQGASADAPEGAPASASAVSVSIPLKETDLQAVLKEAAKSGVLTLSCVANDSPDLLDNLPAMAAVGLEDGRTAFLKGKDLSDAKKALAGALSGKALKVCHDVKAALPGLRSLGLALAAPVFDTMLAAYCLDPGAPRGKPAKDLAEELRRRAGLALGHAALAAAMADKGVLKLFETIETPLLWILMEMEDAGIVVDAAYLRTLSGDFDAQIRRLKAEVDALAGAEINLNSPKQLGELLYDKLQLPVAHKTAKGGRSTDEAALATLAGVHPIPAKVIEYRELAKLKATYIDGLLARLGPGAGRVHTHFDQAGTATGRLSSLDPNLQNIPVRSEPGQKIRRAFTAGPGMALVSADYSQIDLRVLAHVSGDRVLCEAFVHDQDIHVRTAAEVFHLEPGSVDKEHRRRAKAIIFGIVYGQSAHGLAQALGIPRNEAADYIKKCFERYDGVASWVRSNIESARASGLVRTLMGRIRHLPELAAKNTALRQFGERAATNTPIQGGSADVIKAAMLKVASGLRAEAHRFRAVMLLQIHDELLFEVPEGSVKEFSAWVRGVMETAVALKIPLKVDVKAGRNWQDMRPV